VDLEIEAMTPLEIKQLHWDVKLLHLNAVMAEILRIGKAQQAAIREHADAEMLELMGDEASGLAPGCPALKARVKDKRAVVKILDKKYTALSRFGGWLDKDITVTAKAAGY
jgi:hypothetical protein